MTRPDVRAGPIRRSFRPLNAASDMGSVDFASAGFVGVSWAQAAAGVRNKRDSRRRVNDTVDLTSKRDNNAHWSEFMRSPDQRHGNKQGVAEKEGMPGRAPVFDNHHLTLK